MARFVEEIFILETAGGDLLLVFGIHEAKIKFRQYEFNHLALVANLTDDVDDHDVRSRRD